MAGRASARPYRREHTVALRERSNAEDEREALERSEQQQGAEYEGQEEKWEHRPVVRQLEVYHQAERGVGAQA